MNRGYLVQTLELIKPALATTNMVPIFQCFNFMEGTVSAYNDTIAIVGPSEFEWDGGIHGNTLLGLLSSSNAEEADITLEKDTAILVMGKSISKLPFQTHDNFIFEIPENKWSHKIPFTESLHEAIKMCLETVSNDETQLALHGVTVELDKLYSCNGDTITRVQLKHGGKGRTLMSTQFCSAVIKLWSTLTMTKGTLHFNGEWVFADFGEWSVYGRILEIKDPIDFEALIKKTVKNKTPTQPVPDEFSGALSRARVLADAESKMTTISVSKGKLKMRTETHMGEVKDELTFKGHPDIDANVNAQHLQKALQYCDQIAFHENCTILEKGDDVLQLVSNLG